MDLYQKKCVPCEGGVEALTKEQALPYLAQLGQGWTLAADGKKIARTFEFKNFVGAMAFVDKVADVAEVEGHHPDIHIFYSRAVIELTTHAILGLSENDFILASKIDRIR